MQETFNIISLLDTTAAESLKERDTIMDTLLYIWSNQRLNYDACVTLYITPFMPTVQL